MYSTLLQGFLTRMYARFGGRLEPGEAEWLLDTLEGFFDLSFVQPATLGKKRDALNKKLKEAGKPELKGGAAG